jgi:hypothetical protein
MPICTAIACNPHCLGCLQRSFEQIYLMPRRLGFVWRVTIFCAIAKIIFRLLSIPMVAR